MFFVLVSSLFMCLFASVSAHAISQAEAVNWAKAQIGTAFDVDNGSGFQCSDFGTAYINYLIFGNAYYKGDGAYTTYYGSKYYNLSYPNGWQRIANTPDFVPQPGDILCFDANSSNSAGHVAVALEGCTVSVMYGVGQNGLANNGWGEEVKRETLQYYGAWGNFQGVIRPKWGDGGNNNTWVKTNKSSYVVNETVTFTFGYKYTTSVSLGIFKDGTKIAQPEVTGKSSYSCSFSEPGTYMVYVSGWSPSGYEDSPQETFTVTKVASNPTTWVKTNKTVYSINETVTFTFGYKYSTSVSLGIDKDGKRYAQPEVTGKNSYSRSFNEVGTYSVYVSGWSPSGYEDSEKITFTIKNPTYTVTFNANGGSTPTPSKTVTYNSTYGDLPTPTRAGYSFAGWFTAASGGTQVTKDTKVTITANQTLYAQWKINNYTVTFDANGGSTPTPSKTVTYNSTYGDLPTPTRAGYSFTGWFTAASGGTQVSKDTKVTITANHTLYAQWKINNYTVTFDASGGSTPTPSKTVTAGSTYGDLPTPTRAGYSFTGWFTAASGGTQVTKDTKVTITANQTLYAQWKPFTYTVKYNSNGGTGATEDSVHSYDSEKALTKNGFTKKYYTFTGWNTKPDGSGNSYADGAQIKNLTAENGGVITLYAQWKRTVSTKTTLDGHGSYTLCNVKISGAAAPCRVILAAYKGNKLLSAETRAYSSDSESFAVSGDFDTVKVMVWNGLEGMEPISEVEVVKK